MNIFEDIGYLLGNYWQFFLQGLASTVILSTFGTIVGLLLGIFVALGKNIIVNKYDRLPLKILKYTGKGFASVYSTVIRGTPMMVQAMIFKYGCQALGINWNLIFSDNVVINGLFIAGIIVITFNTAAYMGEIIRSGLNGVSKTQIEAGRSLGMTDRQTFMYVVFPQALKNSIPTIGNEWIVNIKDSSVLNVIGVSELYFMSGTVANKGYKFIAAYVIVAVIYLLLTLLTSLLLKMLDNKLDGKKIFFRRHFKGA